MVLDTSAFVAGFDPFTVREEQVVPPKVEEEVKRNKLTVLRFNIAVESGRLKIFAPSKEVIDKVKAYASSVGDSFFLSETDIQVLALALELATKGSFPQIMTDDYSIQNVATKLDMPFVSLTTFGIRRLLSWVRYCPACHRTYPANYKGKECTVCGTALKRKPRRQREFSLQEVKQKNQKQPL
jgi:UPF0271 protein